MGLGGFEPPTSSLSGMRSNQLSYKPLENTHDLSCLDWKKGDQILKVGPQREKVPKHSAGWLPITTVQVIP